jgi:hypothetical protein
MHKNNKYIPLFEDYPFKDDKNVMTYSEFAQDDESKTNDIVQDVQDATQEEEFEKVQKEDKPKEDKQENQAGTWINYSDKIGAGLLPVCEKTGRVLLGWRSNMSPDPETWGEFGVKFSKDAGQQEGDVLTVVKNIFKNQTGYLGDIKLIPSYIYETESDSYKYYNFIGLIPEEFTPTLSDKYRQAKWFTLNDLKNIRRKEFHFGLKLMWEHDGDTIKKYAK